MKLHKRCFFALPLVFMALMGIGCGSMVPISDAAEAVFMNDLVGQWQLIVPEGEDGQMLVLKFDEHTYYIELRQAGTEPFDEDTIRLRAYITEVDGKAFINAQNIDALDEEDRVYFFYTYDIGPDGLLTFTELQDVGDQKIDKFETSEALRTFIRQNLDNEALYGESTTLIKVKEAG